MRGHLGLGWRRHTLLGDLGTKRKHEAAIEKEFAGRVGYEDQSKALPVPLMLLLFTNRCGSNYLAELLRSTEKFSCFREFLNGGSVSRMRKGSGANDFPSHLRYQVEQHHLPNTVFGLKASWDQAAMLMRWNIDKMFRETRLVHMVRQDVVAQAVSFSIAGQTKRWTSRDPGSGNATYSFDDIERKIAAICESNMKIEALVSIIGLPVFKIGYEELVAEPNRVIREVGGWAGLDLAGWEAGPTRLELQRDELNSEFAARYRATARLKIGIG